MTDILRLMRAWNCLIAMAGVWIGACLTWLRPVYYGPLFAGSAAFFACAAGNALNDILDIEIDRVNRPQRVLVRGAISIKRARLLAVTFAVVAVLLGLAVNEYVAAAVVIALLLLAAYNFSLKRVAVVGNLTVGVLAALTFVTGGLAFGPKIAFMLPGPLIPAVFAILFHMVREILKDVEDLDGDRRRGIITLPQLIGTSKSLLLALLLFLLLVVLTYLPVIYGWFGRAYEIITVFVVDLPLLAVLIFVWGNPTPRMLGIGSAGLKFGMVLGLFALLVS